MSFRREGRTGQDVPLGGVALTSQSGTSPPSDPGCRLALSGPSGLLPLRPGCRGHQSGHPVHLSSKVLSRTTARRGMFREVVVEVGTHRRVRTCVHTYTRSRTHVHTLSVYRRPSESDTPTPRQATLSGPLRPTSPTPRPVRVAGPDRPSATGVLGHLFPFRPTGGCGTVVWGGSRGGWCRDMGVGVVSEVGAVVRQSSLFSDLSGYLRTLLRFPEK